MKCTCNDQDDNIPKLYTTAEAGKFLRLSGVGVRDLCRAGKLPARKLRNRWFLTTDDIRKAMKVD